MVHLHNGILRSREKEGAPTLPLCLKISKILKKKKKTAERKELLLFATAWMELESIMLSEISQVVRDKSHMISPLTGT